MKLRREARLLKEKALDSLRRAVEAFNSFDDGGRRTAVLLHTQHAFEMLLKAGLVQNRVRVFDPRDGRSIGPEKCTNLATEHLELTESEAGLIRAIDALRDDEQHWIVDCSEGLLYVHVRAAVTLFDDLLKRAFDDRLVNHWPHRVLPISAEPPRDVQVLIDEEFTQIAQLLAPNTRRSPEARARIRSLLAMEAHLQEGVVVSKNDVTRIERAIKRGSLRAQAFPRLSELVSDVAGDGAELTVRFSKTDGLPVRLVGADAEIEAAAVREVDLQRKFHWTKGKLAEKLGLTLPKSLALRHYLEIEDDPSCVHDFSFGKSVHRQYSDNAYRRMKEALDEGANIDEIWRTHSPAARSARVAGPRDEVA